MATKNGSAFCPNCNRQVLTVRQTPNHVLHLLLAILTGGLWLIVWFFLVLSHQPEQCTSCGITVARIPRVGLAMVILTIAAGVGFAWYSATNREPPRRVDESPRPVVQQPKPPRPMPTAIQVADLPPPVEPSPFAPLVASDPYKSDVIRKRIEESRSSPKAAKVYQLREWTFTNRPPLKGRLRQYGPIKTQIEEENYDLHEFNTADLSKESRAFIAENLN